MVINAVDSPGHTAITRISPSTPSAPSCQLILSSSIFLFLSVSYPLYSIFFSGMLCSNNSSFYFFPYLLPCISLSKWICPLVQLSLIQLICLCSNLSVSLTPGPSVSDLINLFLLKSVCLSDSRPVCLRFKSIFLCLSVSGASPSVSLPPRSVCL
jgi:hypothetical protein